MHHEVLLRLLNSRGWSVWGVQTVSGAEVFKGKTVAVICIPGEAYYVSYTFYRCNIMIIEPVSRRAVSYAGSGHRQWHVGQESRPCVAKPAGKYIKPVVVWLQR